MPGTGFHVRLVVGHQQNEVRFLHGPAGARYPQLFHRVLRLPEAHGQPLMPEQGGELRLPPLLRLRSRTTLARERTQDILPRASS